MMGNNSKKREAYYEKAVHLYFKERLRGTEICKILPISRTILYKWIANFAEENPQVLSMRKGKEKKTKKQTVQSGQDVFPEEVAKLQAELKRVRAQLTKAEVKAEAYEELINVAETRFNISIRKKAGAKQ